MNCQEFRAAYLQGEKTADAHLAHCADCRAELAHLDDLHTALGESALWEDPPAVGERRLVEAIVAQRPHSSRWRWAWVAVAAVAVITASGVAALTLSASRPNWEVSLAGTEEAVGATATVVGWRTEAGMRMELTAEGLAAAPDGYYYELWLSAPDKLVSAGTFRYGEGVVLWSGASRADVPRLWVTLEPLDGDAEPSGVTVLDSG